jgi:hypothetical protein
MFPGGGRDNPKPVEPRNVLRHSTTIGDMWPPHVFRLPDNVSGTASPSCSTWRRPRPATGHGRTGGGADDQPRDTASTGGVAGSPAGRDSYLLVRIGGSFVYMDVITGDEPDAEKAHAAVTALLT